MWMTFPRVTALNNTRPEDYCTHQYGNHPFYGDYPFYSTIMRETQGNLWESYGRLKLMLLGCIVIFLLYWRLCGTVMCFSTIYTGCIENDLGSQLCLEHTALESMSPWQQMLWQGQKWEPGQQHCSHGTVFLWQNGSLVNSIVAMAQSFYG